MGDWVNIGSLSVQIEGDWSDLQTALDEAAGAAQAGAQQIASGLASAGTAADTATPEIEGVGAAATAAGDEAGHAGSAFDTFGEALKKVAEIGGLTLGVEQAVELLKEFASECMEAASQVQFVTVALTALTGSAAAASETLSHAAEIASNTTSSFMDLAKSAQSMAAMGVETATINESLEAMAQWSELSGKSLDTLTGAMERVYMTGQVSNRTFVSLGVSAEDMAGILGVAADKVKTTIANMGAENSITLDALALAMKQKVGDAATQAADTNAVAINRMQTAWHEFTVALGNETTGIRTTAANAFSQILDIATAAAQQNGFLANTILLLTGNFSAAADMMINYTKSGKLGMEMQDALGHTMRSATQDAENQTKAIQANAAAANAAAANKEFLEWQKQFLANYKDYGPAIDAADAALNKFNADQFMLNAVLAQAVDTYAKVVAEGGNIGNAYKQMESAAKAAGVSQQDLADKAGAALGQLGQLPVLTKEAAAAFDQMHVPMERVEDDFTNLGVNIADPVVAAVGRIQDAVAKNTAQLQTAIQTYLDLANSGTASGAEIEAAYKEAEAAAKSLNMSVADLDTQIQTVNADLGNLPILTQAQINATDKMRESIIHVTSAGKTMGQEIGQAFSRDLAKGISDVILQTGNLSQAFTKLGQDVLDVILNNIIKQGVDALMSKLSELGGMFKSVFGSVSSGAASGAASGASAAASGAASGMSGAASAVGGAVSGAMGMVGAIGSAVSAVSGIISNFQMAHQTDILRSIELNTRETAMFIGGLGGGGVTDWLQAIAVNTTPLLSINTWVHDSWVNLLGDTDSMKADIKKMANTPMTVNITISGAGSPQQTAQAVAAYLKNISPAFSP